MDTRCTTSLIVALAGLRSDSELCPPGLAGRTCATNCLARAWLSEKLLGFSAKQRFLNGAPTPSGA